MMRKYSRYSGMYMTQYIYVTFKMHEKQINGDKRGRRVGRGGEDVAACRGYGQDGCWGL